MILSLSLIFTSIGFDNAFADEIKIENGRGSSQQGCEHGVDAQRPSRHGTAGMVYLAKHLLPMAADARCVLPPTAPLRSVQAMPHASSLPIVCTH